MRFARVGAVPCCISAAPERHRALEDTFRGAQRQDPMKFLDMVGSSPITGVSAIRYTQLSPATCVRRSGSCTLRRVRCSAADDASPGTSSAAGADTGLRPGGEMTRAPPPLPVKGMKVIDLRTLLISQLKISIQTSLAFLWWNKSPPKHLR